MKYIAVAAGSYHQFKEFIKWKGFEGDGKIGFDKDIAYVYVDNSFTAGGYRFYDYICIGTVYERPDFPELMEIIKSRIIKD